MVSRLKLGDLVRVISGKEKGKEGVVLAFSKDRSRVQVRDVALASKFVKRRTGKDQNSNGVVKVERFMHASNVMPICPETKRPCRVRVKVLEDGKRVRVSHLSGVEL